MRRLVFLLIGGFVLISVAVAMVPEVTSITISDNVSEIPAVTAVSLNIAKWLIPLAFGVGVVLFGLIGFGRSRRGRR